MIDSFVNKATLDPGRVVTLRILACWSANRKLLRRRRDLPSFKRKAGASGEIRTLKHVFLRQATIPIRARWHLVHRGGFEPPRPTRGDRVTAGPFRPGSRTCANLAEGRRIEHPSLITMPRFSGPVADNSAVPSTWRRERGLNPLASCEKPVWQTICDLATVILNGWGHAGL